MFIPPRPRRTTVRRNNPMTPERAGSTAAFPSLYSLQLAAAML